VAQSPRWRGLSPRAVSPWARSPRPQSPRGAGRPASAKLVCRHSRPPRCDIIGNVRLVLDTNVVVAAMRSPAGASAAILRAARQGHPTLLVSVPLALECEAICCEPEHRMASGLSEREVDVFLTALIALAEAVETHFLWRPQLRDPGDEMVLEAAVNGRANVLVTFNLRDFGTTPSRFGMEILLPREAIRRIKS
jgi:putative PIN family toxin of toxin-antitoxin system